MDPNPNPTPAELLESIGTGKHVDVVGEMRRAADQAEMTAPPGIGQTLRDALLLKDLEPAAELVGGPRRPLPRPVFSQKLDEKALRRPEFEPGIPIVLHDGQAWHFPELKLGAFRAVRVGNELDMRKVPDLGVEYAKLLDEYLEADAGFTSAMALYTLALTLLSINYSLTFGEVATLLPMTTEGHPRHEANDEMWALISDAVLGRAKKATPAG